MSKQTVLTHEDVRQRALQIATTMSSNGHVTPKVYPVPRGGVMAAMALASVTHVTLVDSPEEADCFMDDIIDTGSTMQELCDAYPGLPFYALVDKGLKDDKDLGWVVFPWEQTRDAGIEPNIVRLLQFCGDDASREGLLETPRRVAKAWSFWTKGYGENPADVLKVFTDGAKDCDEMVIVRDIPFYSKCEHHMADIFGTASIAYIPNGKIVGLSKLSRVLDVFARRLQVQERLTNQVADAIFENLDAKGVGVVIKARHMCMESRGICQQGHHTVTSALRGVIKDQPETRAEFMTLIS